MINITDKDHETFLREGFDVFLIQEEPEILQVQRVDDAKTMTLAVGFNVPQLKNDEDARRYAQKYLHVDINNHVIAKRHE